MSLYRNNKPYRPLFTNSDGGTRARAIYDAATRGTARNSGIAAIPVSYDLTPKQVTNSFGCAATLAAKSAKLATSEE